MNTKNKTQKEIGSFEIKGVKGFRRLKTGGIEAHKSIDGKRYWKYFETETDAYYWKKNYHPILNPNPERKLSSRSKELLIKFNIQNFEDKSLNGKNQEVKFQEVWRLYLEMHLVTKELHTQQTNERVARNFYGPPFPVKMCEINRSTISHLIDKKKKETKANPHMLAQRYNFNNELKKLSTLFNWYKKSFDPSYENPICDLHKSQGFMRHKKVQKKKMTAKEVNRFLEVIKGLRNGQFWSDFAEAQLYMSARVSEVGGLQWESIDLEEGTIEIRHVAVYIKKRFHSLKDHTKNGESRTVTMNGRLREIFKRRFAERDENSEFVFQLNGLPPSMQRIDAQYNKAFKRAKLPYSGTHCLRHTMANLIRNHLSLDHAKALGGWKSSRVVELIYTETPTRLKQESVDLIEKVLREEKEK